MNYVPKLFLALLTLITMAASLFGQGTAAPGASATPKAAASPGPAPKTNALTDIVIDKKTDKNANTKINR
jgi:hypothetical protein